MDQKPVLREIFSLPHVTDGLRVVDFYHDVGFYDQRHADFATGICFSSHQRRAQLWTCAPYAMCILGIGVSVFPPWHSLEYDDGNGSQIVPGNIQSPRVTAAYFGLAVAVYGAYAFVKRSIPSYLFLRTQFVFFDYEEPLVFFFLDYLAIMGLFVFIGHFLAAGCPQDREKESENLIILIMTILAKTGCMPGFFAIGKL